jgi:glycosyltransferase involved in cell wall biosynthesis
MVSREPVVTVLMATRNGSQFIEQAIRSVLRQTYTTFEFLIIDDASSDTTRELISATADTRMRLLSNPQRLGLTRSLNRGLAAARGAYIARIDDDDVWPDKDKLERQVSFMVGHPRVGLVGTQNIVVDAEGQELYRLYVESDDHSIRCKVLAQNQFFHSAVLIRGRALDEVGTYDEGLRFAQDYELWLRIGRRWEFANLPEVYIKQRVNPWGVTGRHNMRQFLSFVNVAWTYRRGYPNFWRAVPIYVRELVMNLLSKRIFYRVRTWK